MEDTENTEDICENIFEYDIDDISNLQYEETLELISNKLDNYIDDFNKLFENIENSNILSENNNIEDSSSDDEMKSIQLPNVLEEFTDKEREDFETQIDEFINEYIQNEIENIHKSDFHEIMKTDITELVFEQMNNIYNNKYDEDRVFDDIYEEVSSHCDNFFEINEYIPPRSFKNTFIVDITKTEFIDIQNQLRKLKDIKQVKQRTDEWYNQRNNLITASNIWKVFSTESQQNSLICEKCKPTNDVHFNNVNVLSPLHWGTKFEPLTTMLYEKLYNTKITEFGCIPHSKYSFLGASPDGIIIDEESELFGRMIEIKNIVNRDITGIPKMEYWIQMQMQMETCNLNYCDFVETRFKLFETEDDFYDNMDNREHIGVILYFINKPTYNEYTSINNSPHYVFMPLENKLDKDSIEEWIKNTKTELMDTHTLFEVQYWYLDEISIVLVKRNQEWFHSSISKIESIWNKIETYRKNGNYEELIGTKRKLNNSYDENKKTSNFCVIKLDENGDNL
jgi:putative phage-type endonuclease